MNFEELKIERNSGNQNSGNQNSGSRNSGNLNSGSRNSGDLNSGYRNSGVFCTRGRKDTVPFFNKESDMTWDEWYDHPAYNISHNLKLLERRQWNDMSADEKKDNPQSFVMGGMLITYTYYDAWKNLWGELSDDEKKSFQTLPNFDSSIFKEVTGIDICSL